MDKMTSRERMITAMKKGIPDRVPVCPDISNMIPCRLTGKPFWEVYVNSDPNLADAYIEAIKYFGIDGWYTYGGLRYKMPVKLQKTSEVIEKTLQYWKVRNIIETPKGDLTEILISPRADPPTNVEKLIKDFEKDFEKYKYLYQVPVDYDDTNFKRQKASLGEWGVMCAPINPPGLHIWVNHFQGSLEAVTYAYYDYPELFEELRILHEKQSLKMLEMTLEAGVDSILTGGSGSITLQSPSIWRELSLPTIKKITKMCKEAGVISGIHSCGRSEYLIKSVADETDLDYVNPIEIPPMGDYSLEQAAKDVGYKMCLMGNLHTTEVMLKGSKEKVKHECLKAILAAGINGSFILSTGDQCGRDTPDENIFEMVSTVKDYGRYPLDVDRIVQEISRLERLV
jgi:uroporphyrinogen decarboxylase